MKAWQEKQLNLAKQEIYELLGLDFEIKKMEIAGLSNEALLAKNGYQQVMEEYLAMHNEISSGNAYMVSALQRIQRAIDEHQELPVVRFADGEYEFYDYSLKCNGLYEQARSVEHIKQSIPLHVSCLRHVSEVGMLAPLLFPGNLVIVRAGWNPFSKPKGNEQGKNFLRFLKENQIKMHRTNYLPFYAVYSLLTSDDFVKFLNGRKVCIVNSEFNQNECNAWFARRGSGPQLSYVNIPATYVATEWQSMRDDVLKNVPGDIDLFLVGAGVGALLVCSDLSKRYSVPAIDAGHVLNMMNGKIQKSNGDRLYTFPEPSSSSL